MKSKALLLLFIFLLNTATGVACALRMSIHEHEEATEHHHEGSEATEHGHHGDEAMGHHHEHQQVSLSPSVHEDPFLSRTFIAENDPCCQSAVNTFNSLAKVTPQSGQIILLAPLTYIGAYHQFFLKPVTVSQANRFVTIDGRRRPPTYPIRIALQSFQI